MAKQKTWDKYEVAILLDAYLRVERGELSRSQAIQNVSDALRSRAIASGMPIDSVFRNTNGISLQYGTMQYVMTNGKRGMSHAPRKFKDMVQLYREDPEAFSQLVAKAYEQVPSKVTDEPVASSVAQSADETQGNGEALENNMIVPAGETMASDEPDTNSEPACETRASVKPETKNKPTAIAQSPVENESVSMAVSVSHALDDPAASLESAPAVQPAESKNAFDWQVPLEDAATFNDVVRWSKEPHGALGMSAYEAIAHISDYRFLQVPSLPCVLDDALTIDDARLNDMCEALESFVRARASLDEASDLGPWKELGITSLDYDQVENTLRSAEQLDAYAMTLEALRQRAASEVGIDLPTARDELSAFVDALCQFPSLFEKIVQQPKTPDHDGQQGLDGDTITYANLWKSAKVLVALDGSFVLPIVDQIPLSRAELEAIRKAVVGRLEGATHYAALKSAGPEDVDRAVSRLQEQIKVYTKARELIAKSYFPEVFSLDHAGMELRFKTKYTSAFGRRSAQHNEDLNTLAKCRRGAGAINNGEAMRVLGLLHEMESIRQGIEGEKDSYAATLGNLFNGVQTDFDQIERSRQAFTEATRLLQILDVIERTAKEQDAANEHQVPAQNPAQTVEELVRALRTTLDQSAEAFAYLGLLSGDVFLSSMDVVSLKLKVQEALRVGETPLRHFAELRHARHVCDVLGLGSFLDAWDKTPALQIIEPGKIGDVFMHTFYCSWLAEAMKSEASLLRDSINDAEISSERLAEALDELRELEKRRELEDRISRAELEDLERRREIERLRALYSLGEIERRKEVEDLESRAENERRKAVDELRELERRLDLAERESHKAHDDLRKLETIRDHEERESRMVLESLERRRQLEERESRKEIERLKVLDGLRELRRRKDVEDHEKLIKFEKREEIDRLRSLYRLREIERHKEVEDLERRLDLVEHERRKALDNLRKLETIRDLEERENQRELERREELEERERRRELGKHERRRQHERHRKKGESCEPLQSEALEEDVTKEAYPEQPTVDFNENVEASLIDVPESTAQEASAFSYDAESFKQWMRDNHFTSININGYSRLISAIESIVERGGSPRPQLYGCSLESFDKLEREVRANPAFQKKDRARFQVLGRALDAFSLFVHSGGSSQQPSQVATSEEQAPQQSEVDNPVQNESASGLEVVEIADERQTSQSPTKEAPAEDEQDKQKLTIIAQPTELKEPEEPYKSIGVGEETQATAEPSKEAQLKEFTKPISVEEAPSSLDDDVTPNHRSKDNSTEEPEKAPPTLAPAIIYSAETFKYWLLDNGVSNFNANSYSRSITTIENVVEASGSPRPRLYGCTSQSFAQVVNSVWRNPGFIERDKQRYHLLNRALTMYTQFVKEFDGKFSGAYITQGQLSAISELTTGVRHDGSEHLRQTEQVKSPKAQPQKESISRKTYSKASTKFGEEGFKKWMLENGYYASITYSYMSALKDVESILEKSGSTNYRIFGCTAQSFRMLESEVEDYPDYVKRDKERLGLLSHALKAFACFVRDNSLSPSKTRPLGEMRSASTIKTPEPQVTKPAAPKPTTPLLAEPKHGAVQPVASKPKVQQPTGSKPDAIQPIAPKPEEPLPATPVVGNAIGYTEPTQEFLNTSLEELVGRQSALPLSAYDICNIGDLTLYTRDELLELPGVTNTILMSIERRAQAIGQPHFSIDGSARTVFNKRALTRDEMLALELPVSLLEVDASIKRQLQRNTMDTCRKVAFTTFEEFLDYPGIDLETAFLLEAEIGRMLGNRVFLGRRKGGLPFVAVGENPLEKRLSPASRNRKLLDERPGKFLIEWVATLPTSTKGVLQAFLEGVDEEEIAQQYGVTLDGLWDVVADALIKKPFLKEDYFFTLFHVYQLTLAEFCFVTEQPPTTYRYLEAVCAHGTSNIAELPHDSVVDESIRRRASRCPLGTTALARPSRLLLSPEAVEPASRGVNARKGPFKTYTNYGASKQTIMRIAEKNMHFAREYSIAHLYETSRTDLAHTQIKTAKDYETALRQCYQLDRDVTFPSQGIIRFGPCDRKRQLFSLRSRLGSNDIYEVSVEYERLYGIGAKTVRYWISKLGSEWFGTPAKTGTRPTKTANASAYAGQRRMQPTTSTRTQVTPTGVRAQPAPKSVRDQQLEFLRSELTSDCCDRKLLAQRFRARFPKGPDNPFDASTLAELGFVPWGKKLLMRAGVDANGYFDSLIMSRERFTRGDKGFENAVFNDSQFRKILRGRMRSFDIVEFEKESYISLEALCKAMPIEPDDVKNYSKQVARAVGPSVPFTIWSLRHNLHYSFGLDKLATEGGVGEYLFETLLDIDPRVQPCTMGGRRCFMVTEGKITAGNVLECIVEERGPQEFGDLLYLLKDEYDINMKELSLRGIIHSSSLYYDDLTESVYNSESEWEEMVEHELAD